MTLLALAAAGLAAAHLFDAAAIAAATAAAAGVSSPSGACRVGGDGSLGAGAAPLHLRNLARRSAADWRGAHLGQSHVESEPGAGGDRRQRGW